MSWKPLLRGRAADRAWAAIGAIARELDERPCRDATLARGVAGRALFFAYLHAAAPDRRSRACARRFGEAAVHALTRSTLQPSLFHGFVGIAWVLEHVRFDGACGAALEPIDEVLHAHLGQRPWAHDFDLLLGLVGHGVYALERLPSPGGAACLTRVVERLTELAEPVAAGVGWRSRPELLPADVLRATPDGYFNLGVAHGSPGVVALLAAAGSPLAAPGLATLLRHRPYPYWVADGHTPTPARAAWCYGEPGVAAALHAAASARDDRALATVAVDDAVRSTGSDADTTGIRDAGLCHGAAGLAHLYNRLWQDSGDAQLAAAARRWLDAALDFRQPGTGIAGFRSAKPTLSGGVRRRADTSFLTGVTGIGLALLAAVTGIEARWDRVLLASFATGRTRSARTARSRPRSRATRT